MLTHKFALFACAVSVFGSSAWASLGSTGSKDLGVSATVANLYKGVEVGSVIALNKDMTLGRNYFPAASEFVVGEDFELYAVKEGSDEPLATGATLASLAPSAYTVIPVNPLTGELMEFNIPDDYKVAGKGGKRRGRGGVTHCYHAAKAILARKGIHLTGEAAYEAAPQLAAKGLTRYSYSDAPDGAACVFNPGGIATSSGGQRYGHIGIKGRGGLLSVESGFHLHRPFVGCYA